MQISAISAFRPAFKGSTMPVPEGAVIKYDEGQPFLVMPLGNKAADTFERKAAPKTSKAPDREFNSTEEAIEKGIPGFRHEDFLY